MITCNHVHLVHHSRRLSDIHGASVLMSRLQVVAVEVSAIWSALNSLQLTLSGSVRTRLPVHSRPEKAWSLSPT